MINLCEFSITQLVRDQNTSEQTRSWFKLELLGVSKGATLTCGRRECGALGNIDAASTG